MFTKRFLRLCSRAPARVSTLPLPFRRVRGSGMVSSPLRYRAVRDRRSERNRSGGREQTTSPPFSPAQGPSSMMWSAAWMICRSCSTTTTVLPACARSRRIAASVAVSRACRPMVGSSSTYRVPTSLDPSWVARTIRCPSPPESVRVCLDNPTYPNPTRRRNPSFIRSLARISCATAASNSERVSLSHHAAASWIVSSEIWLISQPAILTCCAAGRSLEPAQVWQGTGLR